MTQVDVREHIVDIVEHLGHLLPSQGPISTFVHHNTLHGLQHLPFEQAVAEGEAFFGARGYLPVDVMRAHYRAGRIADADLDAVIAARPELAVVEVIATIGGSTVTDTDVRRLHLIHGVNPIDPARLRFLVLERDATRRLMGDVSPETRARGLATAQTELADRVDRVGRDLTLGDFVGELVGVDVRSAVISTALQDLAGGRVARRSVEALLGAVGVPDARRDGYLALVDVAFAVASGAERDTARRAWLAAEARLVDRIARRHLDLPGRLDAIERGLSADPEAYATASLWSACLDAFELPDTLSPTDPDTLEPRDPDGPIDRVGDLWGAIRGRDGPVVFVDAAERSALETAARRALDEARAVAESAPERARDPEVREVAAAAWVVLTELDDGFGRAGVEAVVALGRLRGDADVADVARGIGARDAGEALRVHAQAGVEADLGRLGTDLTHADLLLRLTGTDVAAVVDRYMIRLCSAFLDTGQAAWRMPDRTRGFYGAWHASVRHDPSLRIAGVKQWRAEVAALPDEPAEALRDRLERLGVEPSNHRAYLARVLGRLPGWAAMMAWWGSNPDYLPQRVRPTDLLRYLAVRVATETAVVAQVLRDALGVDTPDADAVFARLRAAPLEHYVRTELHRGALPGLLSQAARDLERRDGNADEWERLAHQVWAWSSQPEATASAEVGDKVWRLFRVAQLAGWSGGEIRMLPPSTRDRILAALDSFPEPSHRPVWLAAFERHYRDEILGALASNCGRGRWQVRDRRPKAQIVFCIDEREESMHRAVDEVDPDYETLGAGGFFNMAMNYSGFDDHHITPLCPAGVVPTNRVKEVPRADEAAVATATARRNRRLWRETADNTYWELKRNAVSGPFVAQLVGLVQSVPLAGRVLAPRLWGEVTDRIDGAVIPRPVTELTVDAERFPGLGFSPTEQVDRIETQLRNIGLTHGFARLVVFMGHGSSSLNNPHESAHDCGACGGKHGAPSARAFAALANRAEVRAELARRGIDIPPDTHFVGGIHNTASDRNTFFDMQDIPETHRTEWSALHRDLDKARALSARERCRRFGSAPKTPSLPRSVRHVEGRARDLSQVRPEWGHCTNAVAVVGRRALTQGLFLDRRTFVISYDPRDDADGSIVQRILLALGPVGAGINLEYYFSTVDNRTFGCDTKVPHNVACLIGVMEGAASDLRTGLPKQMIELHEPMRLLLIVEASTEVLGRIYTTQPAIAELLDNEWVHLVAVDAAENIFQLFVPGRGFVPWGGQASDLAVFPSSFDYYHGREGFLPPVRIEQESAS